MAGPGTTLTLTRNSSSPGNHHPPVSYCGITRHDLQLHSHTFGDLNSNLRCRVTPLLHFQERLNAIPGAD